MKTILFVCVHNAGRSQMAEAFFNYFAKARGLKIRALSAGTMAGKEINPIIKQVMTEIGISLEGQRPRQLTPQMVTGAARMITMGCGVDASVCPAGIYLTEDWGLEDPAGQPIEKVREIRDQIRTRVEALLDEVKDEDC
ncbi:MAG TPA: arsenate reductase ArsC [Candidatus Limnocylindrales bacterium]|nr:arsenate reductase ArsC [Candidatus Limnocylindrales bacterium]